MITLLKSIFFNDDKVSFTCIFPTFYNIFSITPFQTLISENVKSKNITISKAATCSGAHFIAFVGMPADPHFDAKNVMIYDNFEKKELFKHTFDQCVSSIKITPKYLISDFYDHIEIWNYLDGNKIFSAKHAINIHSPIDVSSDYNSIAFLGANNQELLIFNEMQALTMLSFQDIIYFIQQEKNTVKLSDTPLSLISFSKENDYYLTTNTTGQTISVWRCSDNQCIAKCKRGNSSAVTYGFDLSPNNDFLAVITQNSILYFFDLRNISEKKSAPTLKVMHKIPFDDQSISYIAWFLQEQIAIITYSGMLILLTIDEGNCHEVGREQICFQNYISDNMYSTT